ncbi:hypothetical protein ACRAWG_12900 [Methylobacterium sp. P31]
MQPWRPSRSRAARSRRLAAAILAPALLGAAAPDGAARGSGPAWPEPDGTLVLVRPFGRSEIALRLSRRVAGAVDTLTWDGVTFIADTESEDALQARVVFERAAACRAASEAGGPQNGSGQPASRRLRSLRSGRSWAETETRMAPECPASPGTGAAPDVILHKRVALGLPGLGNAIEVQASFVLPERAEAVRFEALAASVPAEFSEAWSFDPGTGALTRLDSALRDQPRPVILAMPEGSHAVAVWSPGPPAQEAGAPRPGFTAQPFEGATRLGCAFRVAQAAAGAHDFACYALVGSLSDVRGALRSLTSPE